MSVPSAIHTEKAMPEIIRRSANFHPSLWCDYFLKYSSESSEVDKNLEQEVQKLKEAVKRMLTATATSPSQSVELIDTIQRLGVSYHFESEIGEILNSVQRNIDDFHIGFDNDDLCTSSLKFRLLRQEGYNISSDMFKKFTNKEGKFKDDLAGDLKGMLSLYEAAHLRVHGEAILEEALTFATDHLKALTISSTPGLSSFLAAQVKHALRQSIWMGLPRVEARHFLSVYQEDPSHDEVLLRLAKLDFNILQKLHQKELAEITRWWKDLDFESKLPFARDRLVECYFWNLEVYFEPQYALARKMATKALTMVSILDDIYDIYGTLEELQLFTDAIDRWDINCPDQLPECMKYFYHSLLQLYKEIEEEAVKEGRGYCIHYAKQAMKKQARSYFDEAKWFHKKYTPTVEEYMNVAWVSSTHPLLATNSFLYMGDIATQEAFDWASNGPKIIRASAIIGRLVNDIVGHKEEQKRGDVASCIECYMKKYAASEQEAYTEFRRQIADAWKDINEEWLDEHKNVPMPLLVRVLNLTRMVDVVYKDVDGYTHSGGVIKNAIKSLFIDALLL